MNKALPGFLFGVLVTLGVLALGAYIGVKQGIIPANADSPSPRVERWAASQSLQAVFKRLQPQKNPLPATDANLIAGIKLYAQDCAVCHGGANGSRTAIAAGMYIPAPDLPKHGVEDDPDQVTYWKIAHGYRWTGMPAFGKYLSSTQMWQITGFLATMDHLPPAAERVWRQVRVSGTIAPPEPDRERH